MSVDRIDYQALEELREMLEDEFSDLVDTYLGDTQSKLDSLLTLNPEVDSDDIRKKVHSMKGASINLGLMHLGNLCRKLEDQAKEGQIEQFSEQLNAIHSEAEFAFSELKRLI